MNKNLTRRGFVIGSGGLAGGAALPLRAQRRRGPPKAASNFEVKLTPHPFANKLLPDSHFGVHAQIGNPDAPEVPRKLDLLQNAGIKWGRQDFTWRRIESEKGRYNFEPYDRLVEAYLKHGVIPFGNLTYHPPFHDPRTPEGVEAYCALARAAVKRYQGKVDYWQLWNEPNFWQFWQATPDDYARMMAAAGKAIHEVSPRAKVLGLNMALADVLWEERILKQVPYDCFDILCFHPYRIPSTPEEHYDIRMLEHYVKGWQKSWHKGDVPQDFPLVHMNFLEQTEAVVKVMEKFGKPKPCWVTEVCWNSHLGRTGSSELRQADMLVRFYVLAMASPRIEKSFWYGIAETPYYMGLTRPDLSPKYSYYAFACMTRRLEGKRWLRNDAFGPDVYAVVFTDDAAGQDVVVAWTTKTYAHVLVNNEKGLTYYDIFGTERTVLAEGENRTLAIPLDSSPVYLVGPKGLKAEVRPDPAWVEELRAVKGG